MTFLSAMVHVYVKQKIPGYNNENLKQAIEAVNEGTLMHKADKQYNIPHETLKRWIVKNSTSKGSGNLF